jgi:hypothetical protein
MSFSAVYEPFQLPAGELSELALRYASNPIFLDNEEWENDDNPYRRQLRPQVIKHLDFSRALLREEILHYESLAAQRLLAVQVATGVAPTVPAPRARVAAVRFLYPERDVTVAGVDLAAHALPPGVDSAAVLAEPGRRLELPPAGHVTSRYGYVVTHGGSAEECWQTAGSAARQFTLRAQEGELVASP